MHPTIRAAWYSVSEPIRLRWARRLAGDYWQRYPLITVYVPTHNRRHLLMTRAVRTVLRQTYPNYELIVAAHGCTDGTEDLIAGLHHHKIRVISVPRSETYPPTVQNHWFAGPVVPANAALAAARGKWIARIDDDDTWTDDHLATLLKFAQDGNYEFVSAAYERERDGVREVVSHDGEYPYIGGTQTWLYRSYLRFMKYNPDCWRKSWNRVNDVDLADRFRRAGVRIGHIDKVVAHVLPRPGEDTVGLEAYRRDAERKLRQLGFN